MKHYEEWHTCDRCGEKIKNTLIRKGKMKIKTEIQNGYRVSDLIDDFELILYTKEAQFELCPKCRKDFVRFMKNEKTEMNNCIEEMRKCYNFNDDKTEIRLGDMISGLNKYVTVCIRDENGTQIEMTRHADELE